MTKCENRDILALRRVISGRSVPMDGVFWKRVWPLQILYLVLTATIVLFLVLSLTSSPAISPDDNNRLFTSNKSLTCDIIEKTSRRVDFPRIIHQTWKDRNIPEKWRELNAGCRRLNPGYKFILWTDADLEKFIKEKYPWFFETFVSYPYPIQRVDAARYFILHYYGGVYLDLDIRCRVPITDVLFTIPPEKDSVLGATNPLGITNSMMISKPRHPFMLFILSRLERVNGWYVLPYWTIMFSTGPIMLWRGYAEYPCQSQVVVLSVQEHNTQYFEHTHGSSWHTWDGPLMVWLDNHLAAIIIIVLLCFTLTIVLIVRRCASHRLRHKTISRDSSCSPIAFYYRQKQ